MGEEAGARPLRIGVSGAGAGGGDEAALAAARTVGREIARAGAILICGGLGGVMAEAARGAREAGGTTVGILPGEAAGGANRWITIPVVTGLGHARNVLIVHTAEALVAIGGSYGTLSEVALALKIGVPVAGLGSWRMEREGHPEPPVAVFDHAPAAVAWALAAAARRRREQEKESR